MDILLTAKLFMLSYQWIKVKLFFWGEFFQLRMLPDVQDIVSEHETCQHFIFAFCLVAHHRAGQDQVDL